VNFTFFGPTFFTLFTQRFYQLFLSESSPLYTVISLPLYNDFLHGISVFSWKKPTIINHRSLRIFVLDYLCVFMEETHHNRPHISTCFWCYIIFVFSWNKPTQIDHISLRDFVLAYYCVGRKLTQISLTKSQRFA
jgi:hypothetical protein